MAELEEAKRREVWAEFQRTESAARGEIRLTKGELREAVDAIDSHLDAGKLSFDQALPQHAREGLTERQKLALFVGVAQQRLQDEEHKERDAKAGDGKGLEALGGQA